MTCYLIEIMGQPIQLADSLPDAVASVQQHLGQCVIGHPGDLADGGDRTLVWLTEDDAEDDDGMQAVAVIRRRDTVGGFS